MTYKFQNPPTGATCASDGETTKIRKKDNKKETLLWQNSYSLRPPTTSGRSRICNVLAIVTGSSQFPFHHNIG